MPPTIVVSELTKSFGRTRALDGLELAVSPGEVHGFLGPNGAGKTTTLRILLGLLKADSGRVEVLGRDPWTDAVDLHRHLAYVPGDVSLWPNLTGGEVIDLLGRLRGGLDPRRRADLLESFDLDPSKKSRAYSKGNRQKVALVAALASDAELLLLDEPTSGLDPLMEESFRRYITEERRDDRTVLLSSHILAEAEALCDRVSIIRAGRTVETGTLAELRHLTRTAITAELAGPLDDPGALDGLPGVHDLAVDGTRVRCEVDGTGLDGLLRRLAGAGIRGLTSQPPTLEQLFLRHYADDDAGGTGSDGSVEQSAAGPDPVGEQSGTGAGS
jgi:ABC-2 type transport system ATP-binding protein